MHPVDESRYVIVDGHVLKRVAGGEIDQGGSEPAAVQPGAESTASQGSEQGTEGSYIEDLYDLEAAPEELRPLLAEELKKVGRNVDAKFREHAEFRQQFEPLAEIEGLKDVPPEELSELVGLRDVFSDPEQTDAWLHELFVTMGKAGEPGLERAGALWASIGEALGLFDGEGQRPGGQDAASEGEGEEVPQWAQELRQEITELKQGHVQGEQARREAELADTIQTELDQLDEAHKEKYDEELDTDAVRRFAYFYDGAPDAIQKGYEDFLRFAGKAQSELAEGALEQPASANGGGRPDTSPERITTFEDAKKAAMERLGSGSPT